MPQATATTTLNNVAAIYHHHALSYKTAVLPFTFCHHYCCLHSAPNTTTPLGFPTIVAAQHSTLSSLRPSTTTIAYYLTNVNVHIATLPTPHHFCYPVVPLPQRLTYCLATPCYVYHRIPLVAITWCSPPYEQWD